ncbi:MAG: hypothetical protein ABH880_03045 [Patescibacteria group bacterium]
MYKRIPVKKLTGKEKFKNIGNKDFSVLEFWQYGFSNLNSNVLRGVLAEFIVENALKDKIKIGLRNPWGDYDVETEDGVRVEVKCASYLQDWDQKDFSRIVWSGLKGKELYWSEAVKSFADLKQKDYKADVYVLALFNHKDPETLDILDMNQWRFYIFTKEKIKEITNNGLSVSLTKLNRLDVKPYRFKEIVEVIRSVR